MTLQHFADRGRIVRRLLPLISAFVLLLNFWAGTPAHAVEAIACGEASTAATGHFEGDRDEVPADSDNSAPHHHGVCHGHCVGIEAGAEPVQAVGQAKAPEAVRRHDFHSGSPPDADLRPPIA